MVKFYMDAHVPWPITKGLLDRGVDVFTVQQEQRERDSDALLLDRATSLGRRLVSMDKDFRNLVADAQSSGRATVGVFAISRKLSYRQCIDDLELIAKCSEMADWADKITFLPL
jgi:predicted nuclease of predicted toxin-antitoxin system